MGRVVPPLAPVGAPVPPAVICLMVHFVNDDLELLMCPALVIEPVDALLFLRAHMEGRTLGEATAFLLVALRSHVHSM